MKLNIRHFFTFNLTYFKYFNASIITIFDLREMIFVQPTEKKRKKKRKFWILNIINDKIVEKDKHKNDLL